MKTEAEIKLLKKTIFIVLSQRHFIVLKKEERVNGRKFNKALFKRNDKKKTGNHIRTKMNFVRSLTRNGLQIFVFRFSFHFCIKTINENAPVAFMFFLAQTLTDMKTFQLLPAEYRHHF